MKVVAACRYRFNSDETQHLHVVWGWTHGELQYRDLFDNHPPLFHMLMAPLFALFPERAGIVVPMRLLMIPFYVASVVAVYRIGRALYSAPVAVWLALIAGALPPFFFPGVEFRPDDLYAALWLWALVLAVESPFTTASAAGIGFLLGACSGITMKTSLIVTSLSMAAGISLGLRRWLGHWNPSYRQLLTRLAAFGFAALVVPALLLLYFAAHHGLREMAYCVLKHNIVPQAKRWTGSSLHYFYLPFGLPFLLLAAGIVYKAAPDPATGARRALIAILPAIYYLLLFSYWPDVTDQDQLPAMPLLPLAAMPLIWFLSENLRLRFVSYAALSGAFILCVALIWRTQVLQRASVAKYVKPIATVLSLTHPDEYVMDLKGDCIYRNRPFYFAIETFTKLRMRLGWIKNDIVEDLVRTRTPVCFHPPFPGAGTMKFIDANYLPLAASPNILVLGQMLPVSSGNPIQFTIAIPAEYILLEGNQPAKGVLDSHPNTGPQSLSAGNHQFVPAAPEEKVTLSWARAWEQGFQIRDHP